jgi:hypothetical protein
MKLLAKLACLFSLLGALAASNGCGQDFNDRVACQSASECGVPVTSSDMIVKVECCAGYCAAVSPGCDSAYRYVTSEPGFGDCFAAPMCIPPDLSITADMSGAD